MDFIRALASVREAVAGYAGALEIGWDAHVDAAVETLVGAGATLSRERLAEIATLAKLCEIAYLAYREGPEAARAAIADPELALAADRTVRAFADADGGRRALAVTHADELIIAIRGSANIVDWTYNVSTDLLGEPRIHAGFTQIAEEMWPWVERLVRELPARVRRITITGHSLGGAAAILLGHRIAAQPSAGASPHVIAFGAPKVGSAEFVSSAAVDSYRLSGDPIPELTPHDDYRHPGASHVLTARHGVRPAPESARSSLLTWVHAVAAAGEQTTRLLRAGTLVGDDLFVLLACGHPYLAVTDPEMTLGELFGGGLFGVEPTALVLQALVGFAHFMREPSVEIASNTTSAGSPQLARAFLTRADRALGATLARADNVVATARPSAGWFEWLAVAVLRGEHPIGRYRAYLDDAAHHS